MDPELQALIGDWAPIPIMVGLLAWFYKKILTLITSGEWVPRATVDLLLLQADKRDAAKDRTIESQERQISALLDGAETTKHAIVSLKEAGTPEGGS